MKRLLYSVVLTVAVAHVAYGQLNNPLSQYNQLPYLQNAALSGIEGYTDIKAGFKKQWATFKGAPQTYLLGVNHVFDKSTPSSDAFNAVEKSSSQRSLKIGVSGYVIENRYNFIRDTQFGLSYAVHVPVSSRYYLSMGLATSYSRFKTDTDELIIRDTQDSFYQDLLAGNGSLNYFNLDAGLVFYSNALHVGYSIQRLARTRFKSDLPGNEESNMRHIVMAGYTLQFNEKWECQPALLFRYESVLKDIYNLSLKFRYNSTLLAGVSYSPGECLSLLTGYRLNKHLSVNYSYDLSIGKTSSVSQGSHEIIIGIMPFNKAGKKSVFW